MVRRVQQRLLSSAGTSTTPLSWRRFRSIVRQLPRASEQDSLVGGTYGLASTRDVWFVVRFQWSFYRCRGCGVLATWTISLDAGRIHPTSLLVSYRQIPT